jgi:hypothetical protein
MSFVVTFTINPGKVMLRVSGQVLVMAKAMGQIGNGFNAVCLRSGYQRHAHITDFGTIGVFVVERPSEIAHRNNQRLFDEISVERNIGLLIEEGQSWPLVDNEGQRFPQQRVGLDEPAFDFFVAHCFELFHQRFGMLSMKKQKASVRRGLD